MSEDKAVFLIGFGGPERQEDVRPFIENVVRGRNVPKERVDLVVNQYATIGGGSPYNRLTSLQAAAIETAVRARGSSAPMFIGMLYSRPSIETALAEMAEQGITRAVGVIMAPHRSEASFEKYINAVEDAGRLIAGSKSNRLPQIEYVESWHEHPLFIEAIADRISEVLRSIPAQVSKLDLQKTRIIFTAHSIPQEMSDKSQYAKQVERTAALAAPAGSDWVVGWQSRSGPPHQKWLEPDVLTQIERAKAAGKTHVIAVPIGFLVDHVEVLYDLDVLAAEGARQQDIYMLRAATVGDHPKFVQMLSTLAGEKIESFYARS